MVDAACPSGRSPVYSSVASSRSVSRWVVLGRLAAVLLIGASVSQRGQLVPYVAGVGAAYAALVGLVSWCVKGHGDRRGVALLALDTILLTLTVRATGGAESPYLMVWALPFLGAGIATRPKAALFAVLASASSAMIAARVINVPQLEVVPPVRPVVLAAAFGVFVAFCIVISRECRARRESMQELYRANESLRRAAEEDYLTKLYNRRYFSDRLQRELGSAQSTGRPVALLLADLDDLKAVNDALGHEAGDNAILRAAAVLSANVRGTDVVARLGGDEFGILLPGASREVAETIAERVTQLDAQATVPLSLTLGIAVYPHDADTAEGLFRAADQDLYKNKALKKARSALAATADSGSDAGADALVLVAEDDPIALESLQELLSMAGYRTAAVSDGSQVVEMVRRLRPDTVLLDVVMPGADGTTVCSEIKSDPDLRLTPVVMVTGHGSRDDKLAAISAGADDFIRKPYDKVELLTRVKALVNTNRLNERLEDLEAVLFSLAKAVEARDPYTQGHGRRVGHYAALLGRAIGMGKDELQALQWGAILHDIGKIGVPDAVLQKPGKLTDEEWSVMRSHPEIGADICAPLKSAKMLLPIIRHHHERWDGRGYPDGLTGEDIPLVARVMAVADAFDAITTDRPYREGCPPEVAFKILRNGAGTQWDPNLIEPFIRAVRADTSLSSTGVPEAEPAGVRPSLGVGLEPVP